MDELREKLLCNLKRNNNGFVTMLGKLVGNIEESEMEKMEKILSDIPFDENIKNNIKRHYKEDLDIKEKSNKIRMELKKIIDKIERNHYRKTAKCCPKRFFFF